MRDRSFHPRGRVGSLVPVTATVEQSRTSVGWPLVGLGGEHSALVPAVVMAVASALGFTASRVGLAQARSSSSAMATS
jgi:hypothetical protein